MEERGVGRRGRPRTRSLQPGDGLLGQGRGHGADGLPPRVGLAEANLSGTGPPVLGRGLPQHVDSTGDAGLTLGAAGLLRAFTRGLAKPVPVLGQIVAVGAHRRPERLDDQLSQFRHGDRDRLVTGDTASRAGIDECERQCRLVGGDLASLVQQRQDPMQERRLLDRRVLLPGGGLRPQVVALAGDDPPDASDRVGDVPVSALDHMDVHVRNGLPGGLSVVDPDGESVRWRIELGAQLAYDYVHEVEHGVYLVRGERPEVGNETVRDDQSVPDGYKIGITDSKRILIGGHPGRTPDPQERRVACGRVSGRLVDHQGIVAAGHLSSSTGADPSR